MFGFLETIIDHHPHIKLHSSLPTPTSFDNLSLSFTYFSFFFTLSKLKRKSSKEKSLATTYASINLCFKFLTSSLGLMKSKYGDLVT